MPGRKNPANRAKERIQLLLDEGREMEAERAIADEEDRQKAQAQRKAARQAAANALNANTQVPTAHDDVAMEDREDGEANTENAFMANQIKILLLTDATANLSVSPVFLCTRCLHPPGSCLAFTPGCAAIQVSKFGFLANWMKIESVANAMVQSHAEQAAQIHKLRTAVETLAVSHQEQADKIADIEEERLKLENLLVKVNEERDEIREDLRIVKEYVQFLLAEMCKPSGEHLSKQK
ncbi:hypothetical protein CONLIGDRAFT_640024 [Coniochaeta ligniaria NRRL 30616]|uniref:Uncharacterized protein n=1 Tax=Coniochaeta ligniaria NRRL 30616 TaxID=1408157 RepID=A0A1J7JU02_9PEZI|nr:hypothetical protein CONLIGDRAFT_640024 [Coniochaeta ligniaria NRRL 30616]